MIIKSVLDVKDDNPMPKGSLPTGTVHFNRSILILTPQRALKFTATSQDRHFVWLTALSFLSHSPLSVNDLNALPPAPPEQEHLFPQPPAPPSLAGSLRRRPIRDSIRIAKNGKPSGGLRSFTTDGTQYSMPIPDRFGSVSERFAPPEDGDYYDPTTDPALPPTIKRHHARNRSNTAPKAPPSSFRVFNQRDVVPSLPHPQASGPVPGPASYAGGSSVVVSTNGSDRGLYTPSLGLPSMPSSRRGSEASATGRPQGGYFNEFNGALRMDAFIEDQDHREPTLPNILPRTNGDFGFPHHNSSKMPMREMYANGHANGNGHHSGRTPVQQNQFEPFYPNGSNMYGTLRSGTLKKKDMGYWGIEEGRGSVSPVDSLMQNEMMLADREHGGSMGGSGRPSVESRMTDPFRGF